MPDDFLFDVFLSHSAKDKSIVRDIAERLKKDGLKVWFDEWVLKPGDSIPAKIEEGLEHSRVLVLCMSANAFGSDWAQLESGTFRFRDPLNKERRFLPLRLDDSSIKGSLAQFLYINWHPAEREQNYVKLLEACRLSAKPPVTEMVAVGKQAAESVFKLGTDVQTRSFQFNVSETLALSGSDDATVRLWDMATRQCLREFEGHRDVITSLDWDVDRRRVLSGSHDKTARMWDVDTGKCLQVLMGHTEWVTDVALSFDKQRALSGSHDKTARLWDIKTGHCLHVLEGHTELVWAVSLSPNGRLGLSGSSDKTVRLWDLETGRCLRVLEGHTDSTHGFAWSSDSRRVLSAGYDSTVRLWEVETGRCVCVLTGHKGAVWCVTFSSDECLALSGSSDGTVRLWELESGRCLRVLEGRDKWVWRVAWSADGRRVFSGDSGGVVRVWDLSKFVTKTRMSKANVPILSLAPDQVQYTNAKVLLVGESGAGKTGLSNYLAHGIKIEDDKPLPSTDGAWATHWALKHDKREVGVEREIWLWDFAGQVDYRLVHQLHMKDAAAAIVVFDPQKENLFEGLGQWDRDIQKATNNKLVKLLAAGRVDRGGLTISAESVKKFMQERGFCGSVHETSAKTGKGCDLLRDAIVDSIDWERIPETTSPLLYHRLKQEILSLRDKGFVLVRLSELKQRMEMTLLDTPFDPVELEAVVGLLAGPGMIQRLDFGGFILLQPEVLSRYAAAAVRVVRQHPLEMGCILESDFLEGKLDYQDFQRLPLEDETVILRALLETFVGRAWCLRQPCDGTAMLTFPSYFRRERLEQPGHPNVLVTYRFDGPTDEIYATLVVRLHHTKAFESADLWRSAADFKTQTGAKLGFTLIRENEGTSRVEIYFEPNVDDNSRVLFRRYIHDHLQQHSQNVKWLRHYACGNKKCDSFGLQFTDQPKIDKALAKGGKGKVFCSDCGKSIHLLDPMETKFETPEVEAEVRKMEDESSFVIDNESKELQAVHHAGFIVAESGQIYRGYTNSDHGIDGEIEFKSDAGDASGKRLYLQLKSGDSYLKKRLADGAEIFQVKNKRWVSYWQQQAYPVMLVIRTSDGVIRWMDVSDYLRRAAEAGNSVTQIIFKGEPFDVMSVRRLRDKLLAAAQ